MDDDCQDTARHLLVRLQNRLYALDAKAVGNSRHLPNCVRWGFREEEAFAWMRKKG